MLIKYPRTPHLPISPGRSPDDIGFVGTFIDKNVVITEKMDGENTSMYKNYIHARSINGVHHPSRDWVKNFHSRISHLFDDNLRICGENVFALHSLEYNDLDTYFYGFSAWKLKQCLSWDETLIVFSELGITPVPVLYRGPYSHQVVQDLASNLDHTKQEGFVVRIEDGFHFDDFTMNVAKYVRPNHVGTFEHWRNKQVVPNKLRITND